MDWMVVMLKMLLWETTRGLSSQNKSQYLYHTSDTFSFFHIAYLTLKSLLLLCGLHIIKIGAYLLLSEYPKPDQYHPPLRSYALLYLCPPRNVKTVICDLLKHYCSGLTGSCKGSVEELEQLYYRFIQQQLFRMEVCSSFGIRTMLSWKR